MADAGLFELSFTGAMCLVLFFGALGLLQPIEEYFKSEADQQPSPWGQWLSASRTALMMVAVVAGGLTVLQPCYRGQAHVLFAAILLVQALTALMALFFINSVGTEYLLWRRAKLRQQLREQRIPRAEVRR